MSARLLFLCLLFILQPGGPQLARAQDDPALKATLEGVYKQWRRAMVANDYAAWKETTALARQMETRNSVVSRGQAYPAAVFAVPMTPPAVDNLRALKVTVKGPTATSVYYGKVDFEVDAAPPEHSLMVLRFLKEGRQWKFFRLALMSQLPTQVIGDIRAGRLDFLSEPEFQPPGQAPEIERACPKPDFVTDIHLISLGFQSEVTVNGISKHATADHFGTQLVTGGLRRGKNTIKIDAQPLKDAPSGQTNLKITLHVKTGDPKNPAIQVFEFKPDPAKGPFTFQGEIMADPSTLGDFAR